jgi:hypothetical protein
MRFNLRVLAAVQAVLIFPAVLFLGSFAAHWLGLAHSPQRIVAWYAARMWTLWVLLLALPLAVLISGGITLVQQRTEAQGDTLSRRGSLALPAAALLAVQILTLTAGMILVIVVLHMAAN